MSDQDKPRAGFFNLDDQAFLKEMGITAMPTGAEFLLRAQQEAADAKRRVEARAEGLQTLELSEEALESLSRETGRPIEELRKELRLFRDVP